MTTAFIIQFILVMLAPSEPTDEMKMAGGDLFDGNSFYWATKCYKAMLAAAPKGVSHD